MTVSTPGQRKGRPCRKCPKVIYGGQSQWEAHAAIHSHLGADRRRWQTRKPYWSWEYTLLAHRRRYPKLWVERTEAKPGAPSEYFAYRQDVLHGPVEMVRLAANTAKSARTEAAQLLELADWGPIVAQQALLSGAQGCAA